MSCVLSSENTRPYSRARNAPACFLLLLSLGSTEPKTEFAGAPSIYLPSRCTSGVVVHKLQDRGLEASEALPLHYKFQSIPRCQRQLELFGCPIWLPRDSLEVPPFLKTVA